MNWIAINERLLELERNWDESHIEEWNGLLSMQVAGILKREKYEVPERKEEGKGKAKKERKRKDVGTILPDMGEKTPL